MDERGQRPTLGQSATATRARIQMFAKARCGFGVELAIEICIQGCFEESAAHGQSDRRKRCFIPNYFGAPDAWSVGVRLIPPKR